jgi:hypothetical protein
MTQGRGQRKAHAEPAYQYARMWTACHFLAGDFSESIFRAVGARAHQVAGNAFELDDEIIAEFEEAQLAAAWNQGSVQ